MDKLHQSSRYVYPSVTAVAAALALARHWLPWELEGPVRHRIRFLLGAAGLPVDPSRLDRPFPGRTRPGRERGEAACGFDSDYDLSSWIASVDCTICGRNFIPKRSSQEQCSEACQRRQAYLDTHPIALQRCLRCRDPFDAQTPRQKYCSTRCQKAASYFRTKPEWGRVQVLS